MKKFMLLSIFCLASHPALAQGHGHHNIPIQATNEGKEPKPADYHSPHPPPPPDQEIRKIAPDEPGNPQENFGEVFTHDGEPFFQFIGDRLEHRSDGDKQIALWDLDAWYGGDYNKFYVESEGEWDTDKDEPETVSMEVFWNHTIRSFWDTQLGIRHDILKDKEDRSFLAAGVQGMAPYVFEVDATAYLSEDGDPSAVFEVERDFYFTQRVVVQPRFETEFAFTDVPEYNIGAGFTGVETGLRVRYEFTRKFAPYIGVSYEQSLGETKDMLEAVGEDTSSTAFVAGLKFWF